MNDYEFQVHITELIEKEDIEQLEKEIGCDKELLNKKTFVGSWMDIAAGLGKEKVIRYLIEKGIDRLFSHLFKTNNSALFRYHADKENLLQMK